MNADARRALLLAALMGGASALAVAITPRRYMADEHPREKLAQLLPTEFGSWQMDRSIVPVPPSPDLQKVLDATYDETVAVTFRDRQGRRVMLSLAYGRNQHKGMNTHRPEVCYPAQGFRVIRDSVNEDLQWKDRRIPVTRLVTGLGARVEPITYWLLVGDVLTHFGYAQRRIAISYGLTGQIPDGVLVRVSSIDSEVESAFADHDRFIRDLLSALAPARLPRLLGRN